MITEKVITRRFLLRLRGILHLISCSLSDNEVTITVFRFPVLGALAVDL